MSDKLTPEQRNLLRDGYVNLQHIQNALDDLETVEEMKKLYKLCFDELKPGGYTAVIVKDRISKGVKEELGYRTMMDMMDIGYDMWDWQRLFMAGSHYTKWHKAQGTEVIQEEHLIMMQKPL